MTEESEAQQRSLDASYRAIFEASEDAIFVHDWASGAIVDANPVACRTYGYSHEEIKRVSLRDLSAGTYPYTEEEGLRLIELAKERGTVRFEWHRRNRDGSLRWDDVCLKKAQLDGRPHILAFTREITERKLAEEELRRSENRLRATVQAALDCIVAMDAEGRIIEFNPAAESCFGFKREEALGRRLSELLIPERYRQAHERGMARYMQVGHGPFLGNRVEIAALRADGSEFPVELAIGVADGRDGKIFIGYLRDIAERKRAEEERTRLEAQLRQSQKMEAIGHLAGGIAHDFNNLLTTVFGYLVLAGERLVESRDPKLAEYLDQAQLSCERARELIQQMLTFSRGRRGKPRPLELAPLVEQAARLLRSSLPATAELTTELAPAVPAVLADPVQLEQVLMNLCINARDAMQGIGAIRVTVGAVHVDAVCASCRQSIAGRFVELCVTDTGTGIAPETLDRMFEPFFTTKEVGKGSGMGLAIVHGIVHEHGGHVLAESRRGEGARFRVLLPAIEADEAAADSRAALRDSRARNAPALRGHVLLVDDEPAVGRFMTELLRHWGLEVTFAGGAQEAQQLFVTAPRRYDIVITDQTMPRMTGLDLARALIALRPQVPVVLYTGYSDGITEALVRSAGACALVRKPVDAPALFGLLQEILARAGELPSASTSA